MELGERIALLRDGRSQTKIAELAGIDPATLNRIERGKNKNPSRATLTAIARALGVETRELLADAPLSDTAPAIEIAAGEWQLSKAAWDALGEHIQLLEDQLHEYGVLLRDARRIAKDAEKTAQSALSTANDVKRTNLRRSRESA